MIEVVAVELVNAVAISARAHEAIDNPVAVPTGRAASHDLIREVATDYTCIRLGIIRLANP